VSMWVMVVGVCSKKRKKIKQIDKKKRRGGGGGGFDHQYKSNLLFWALVQALYTWDSHAAVRELCITDTSIELKH